MSYWSPWCRSPVGGQTTLLSNGSGSPGDPSPRSIATPLGSHLSVLSSIVKHYRSLVRVKRGPEYGTQLSQPPVSVTLYYSLSWYHPPTQWLMTAGTKTEVWRMAKARSDAAPPPLGAEREGHSLWWSGRPLSHRLSWLRLLWGRRRPGQQSPTTFPKVAESTPTTLSDHVPPQISSHLSVLSASNAGCTSYSAPVTQLPLSWTGLYKDTSLALSSTWLRSQTSPLRARPRWQRGRAMLWGE